MATLSTSKQLATIFKEQEILNFLEQKLLIANKVHINFKKSRIQVGRLITVAIYNEHYITAEQLTVIGTSKVKKQRKKIKNISRKLDLFNYFVSTCISRFDMEKW